MAGQDGAGRPQATAGTWPPRGAAQAGSLAPSGAPAFASFLEKLRALARAEAGAGRLLPWVPVAFGSGIALYFAAAREPVVWVALVTAAIEQLGLAVKASHIRAGLVACTGNAGCKFAASDTKRHAAAIGDWCEGRVELDTPLNIHLTGCHHSCAQHYISDIGLIAAKVPGASEDETVEGYHLFAGGGFGPDADIGQEVCRDLKAEDAPRFVEGLLKAYVAQNPEMERALYKVPKYKGVIGTAANFAIHVAERMGNTVPYHVDAH